MKKVFKSKNSEALDKIRQQSSVDNINSFINLLNSNKSSLKIDIEVELEKKLEKKLEEQPLLKNLSRSKTLKSFYENLLALKKDYSYESINNQFKSFFNVELSKTKFRTKEFDRYFFDEDLTYSLPYRLKNLFKVMKTEFKRTNKVYLIRNEDINLKLERVRRSFPLKIKDEDIFESNLFKKLLEFVEKDDNDGFNKFKNELSLILMKSSKNSKHNKIIISFFFDRETFELTHLKNKGKMQNQIASSIRFYFEDNNMDKFYSYEEFLTNFIQLLKKDLSISYQHYLEKSLSKSLNYSLSDSSENLFLNNPDSVKSEIKRNLKLMGINDSLSKDEKNEIVRLIIEILNE